MTAERQLARRFDDAQGVHEPGDDEDADGAEDRGAHDAFGLCLEHCRDRAQDVPLEHGVEDAEEGRAARVERAEDPDEEGTETMPARIHLEWSRSHWRSRRPASAATGSVADDQPHAPAAISTARLTSVLIATPPRVIVVPRSAGAVMYSDVTRSLNAGLPLWSDGAYIAGGHVVGPFLVVGTVPKAPSPFKLGGGRVWRHWRVGVG